jgi:hypothetical protein
MNVCKIHLLTILHNMRCNPSLANLVIKGWGWGRLNVIDCLLNGNYIRVIAPEQLAQHKTLCIEILLNLSKGFIYLNKPHGCCWWPGDVHSPPKMGVRHKICSFLWSFPSLPTFFLFCFFSFSFSFSFFFFHILPVLATLVGIGTLECLTVPTFGSISYPNTILDSQTVQLNQKMVTVCSTMT